MKLAKCQVDRTTRSSDIVTAMPESMVSTFNICTSVIFTNFGMYFDTDIFEDLYFKCTLRKRKNEKIHLFKVQDTNTPLRGFSSTILHSRYLFGFSKNYTLQSRARKMSLDVSSNSQRLLTFRAVED